MDIVLITILVVSTFVGSISGCWLWSKIEPKLNKDAQQRAYREIGEKVRLHRCVLHNRDEANPCI